MADSQVPEDDAPSAGPDAGSAPTDASGRAPNDASPDAASADAPARPRVGLTREEMGDPGLTKEDLRDVPRLPRGRGVRMPFGQIVRIGLTATMLIAVLLLAQPCAEAVGKFVASFDPPDAQPAVVVPKVPAGYVHLTPNKSPQQIQQAIDTARDAGAPAPQPPAPEQAPPSAPSAPSEPPATSSPPR